MVAGTGAATALVAGLIWVRRRRARKAVAEAGESVLWADEQSDLSEPHTRPNSLEELLPDGLSASEKARAVYVSPVGDASSLREASLLELHQLSAKLLRRKQRGDHMAAMMLLHEHLHSFHQTSPWVFLELREHYRFIDKRAEWEVARIDFRKRFNQTAPHWVAPSTADVGLMEDSRLLQELSDLWPTRPTRDWMSKWLLGESERWGKPFSLPILGLGVYRDMLLLDRVLLDLQGTSPSGAAALF